MNVIAWAGPGAISLQARTDSSNGAQATIASTHTAYQSVNTVGTGASFVNGEGNRAEEPLFVYPPSRATTTRRRART